VPDLRDEGRQKVRQKVESQQTIVLNVLIVCFNARKSVGREPRLSQGERKTSRWVTESSREARADLREMLKPGRPLCQVTLEPPQRRTLVLRRSALGVEVDELQRILQREIGSSRRGRSIAARKPTRSGLLGV
jgi:hypothetical protein